MFLLNGGGWSLAKRVVFFEAKCRQVEAVQFPVMEEVEEKNSTSA